MRDSVLRDTDALVAHDQPGNTLVLGDRDRDGFAGTVLDRVHHEVRQHHADNGRARIFHTIAI